MRNSVLYDLYDKNLGQLDRIRILRSLLFVTDCHGQHIKNVSMQTQDLYDLLIGDIPLCTAKNIIIYSS